MPDEAWSYAGGCQAKGVALTRRRVIQIGALVWAVVGGLVAFTALSDVNPDARFFVGFASVLGPAAAIAASIALSRRRDRLAGVLLIVSVITPTYFAWVLNVPALLVGLILLIAPRVAVEERGSGLEPVPNEPHEARS